MRIMRPMETLETQTDQLTLIRIRDTNGDQWELMRYRETTGDS